MAWKDASGRALEDYPHPSLAVDVALLTVHDARLCVLLHQAAEGFADGRWALPGTFVRIDETLSQAALRTLRDKGGVTGRVPRQLRAFDALHRDERGRVVSVAHVDLVPTPTPARAVIAVLAPVDGERAVPPDRQRRLPFDHDEIVAEAVRWARERYSYTPDPEGLLDTTFTLAELRDLHAAVLGPRATPLKDTFRRRMQPQLQEVGALSSGHVGKPARLFRRR